MITKKTGNERATLEKPLQNENYKKHKHLMKHYYCALLQLSAWLQGYSFPCFFEETILFAETEMREKVSHNIETDINYCMIQ